MTGVPMRIAQISPPHNATPPRGFGGSELVASNLTQELVRRGHQVVLFAHPDSSTDATLVSFPEAYQPASFDHRELVHVARSLEYAHEFDIVHNHCLSAGPALARLVRTPCVITLHYLHPILLAFPDHPCVAVSKAQQAAVPGLNILRVVYNGVDCSLYPVVESKSDYLLFMGRIDPKKGPDLAVQVARSLGARLVLAGPPPTEDMRDFFDECIRPYLGARVEYVGEARGQQKVDLLAHAICLLLPLRWEEPFGLVAVEAMACGTPVVALRRGALPELVRHGETGYIVDTLDQMVQAVQQSDAIRPWRCRGVVERDFSSSRMADAYLEVYSQLLEGHAGARGAGSGPARWADGASA